MYLAGCEAGAVLLDVRRKLPGARLTMSDSPVLFVA